MVLGLYEQRSVFVRSLGDHIHFKIPGWRALLSHYGVVEGDRVNCHQLMQAGETILVFPGGAREVFKRKGEKYHLIWGRRAGFARLAIEHCYPIVPFAAVGAEECYDILLDAGDLLASPVGALLRQFVPRIEEMPPLVRGLGPTLLPRPQRFYFAFGAPIETARFAGRHDDDATCFAVRELVRAAIETEIAELLWERRHEAETDLLGPTRRPVGAAHAPAHETESTSVDEAPRAA
jgi:1-acyl-sn-glycerol-3-phosphate acyltransferase